MVWLLKSLHYKLNICSQVLLCIDALKKILNKQENEQAQEKLFDDGERVLLQITGIKLPKDERKQFIRM
jgi:hypothetical protein